MIINTKAAATGSSHQYYLYKHDMFVFMKRTEIHFGKTVDDAFISFNRETAAT